MSSPIINKASVNFQTEKDWNQFTRVQVLFPMTAQVIRQNYISAFDIIQIKTVSRQPIQ